MSYTTVRGSCNQNLMALRNFLAIWSAMPYCSDQDYNALVMDSGFSKVKSPSWWSFTFGGFTSIMPKNLFDLHLWPQQCITPLSGVLPANFWSHRILLNHVNSGWPSPNLFRAFNIGNALHYGHGFFLPNLVARGFFKVKLTSWWYFTLGGVTSIMPTNLLVLHLTAMTTISAIFQSMSKRILPYL